MCVPETNDITSNDSLPTPIAARSEVFVRNAPFTYHDYI